MHMYLYINAYKYIDVIVPKYIKVFLFRVGASCCVCNVE
jgi:hypothetical protein